MFFSCHVRAVQWPPYFLQGSNRHNNKNKEQPWSSLHFSLPRLLPTERGDLEKVPSRLFRVCSRWWYKKTLHSRSSSRDLVGISTSFFFFFFTSIVIAVLSHCELTHIHKNKWDYTSSYFLKILGGLGLVFLSYICKACKTDISSMAKASGCQTCSRCVHINLKISFKPSLLYKNQLIYWDNRSKYQKE